MQATLTRESVRKAAGRLGVEPETVRRYIRKGDLSATTKNGRGVAQTLWLDPLEVDAFIRGGIPAAEAYRLERDKPAIPARRGRSGK